MSYAEFPKAIADARGEQLRTAATRAQSVRIARQARNRARALERKAQSDGQRESQPQPPPEGRPGARTASPVDACEPAR